MTLESHTEQPKPADVVETRATVPEIAVKAEESNQRNKPTRGIAAYFQPVTKMDSGARNEATTSLRRSARARREIKRLPDPTSDAESEVEKVSKTRIKARTNGSDSDSDFEILSVASSASEIGNLQDEYGEASSSSSSTRPVKRRKVASNAAAAAAGTSSKRRTPSSQTKKTPLSATAAGISGALKSTAAAGSWRPHAQPYHEVTEVEALVPDLLSWFERVRELRAMPWRKPFDPSLTPTERGQRAYEIWVSEVMLQQTQVATVIPYWRRWLERWPTLADLARADVEEVNGMWKGLGYYRRARSLLAGAKRVMADEKRYRGRLPDDPARLEKEVEGIGRYTAGAICSMAYGVRTPIVDGNIHRLLCRLLAIHAPSTSPALLKHLWASATTLVEGIADEREGVAGDLNQALMELGSQVCKPVNPDCRACPLQKGCKAYRELSGAPAASDGPACDICVPPVDLAADEISRDRIPSVTIFPMRKAAKEQREESTAVCVVRWKPIDGGEPQWLFVKRQEKGLLAGLFEPPSVPVANNAKEPARVEVLRDHLPTIIDLDEPIRPSARGNFVHVFSHIRMTYHVHLVNLSGTSPPRILSAEDEMTRIVWVTKSDLHTVNIGTGVKKVWDLLYGKNSWPQAVKG